MKENILLWLTIAWVLGAVTGGLQVYTRLNEPNNVEAL